MDATERLKKALEELEKREKQNYDNIMKGEYLSVDPLILNNEEEIVWNFKKEKLLQEDCPTKYLVEIFVNTQSRNSHFSQAVAYATLKKNFTAGPLGREIIRRMWIADDRDNLSYKVNILSIEKGKQSKLWKG